MILQSLTQEKFSLFMGFGSSEYLKLEIKFKAKIVCLDYISHSVLPV